MRALLLTRSTFLSLGLGGVGLSPGALGQGPVSAPRPDEPSAQYLGDHPELILSSSQAWGELGWNAAAHPAGKDGDPLQIGSKIYAKGLGHHANGSIQVLLDGRYAGFDAVVGLQPCGAEGSVIFRVFADDEKRFDSGILRATNAPQPVHVDLAGAQELRLEANDAGDGISCDMANWAEARLRPAGAAAGLAPRPSVDVARFARVVTWDPNRTDGARANRIEEFRAEDLFLDTNLPMQADGTYRVPVSPNGLGCIGLQWLNRRALKELGLEFSDSSGRAGINGVQVQGWFGESAWQGGWKPLAGEVEAAGQALVFRLSPRAGAVQTQKVRWVFRATEPMVVRRLTAFTRSSWQTVKLVVELVRLPLRDERLLLRRATRDRHGPGRPGWRPWRPSSAGPARRRRSAHLAPGAEPRRRNPRQYPARLPMDPGPIPGPAPARRHLDSALPFASS
jgi:hypothetical protein